MAWISPTGDSGGDWGNRIYARDNNTDTYAETVAYWGYLVWTGFLTLTHTALYCDKIKYYIGTVEIFEVDIDVYYSGAWHHVFQGAEALNNWHEHSLGGTYSVTAVRIRKRLTFLDGDFKAYFYDLQFNELFLPTVTTQTASSVGENGATLNGNITDTGGENYDERGFDWGLTDSYGSSWTQEGSYGTGAFNHALSGLLPGTTYHFRAKAHNSAGWGYGSDVEFTTDTHDVVSSDTGSGADATYKARAWTKPLELTINAITAYRARFWALKNNDIDEIDLDVYWSGAYNHIYQGSFIGGKWESKTFEQNSVTKARVSFFMAPTATARLHDLQFYKVIE